MSLIPQLFIDELLQRTDLVELIDGYLPLKKQGNSYIACCPFHNEKTPSFNVIAKKQFYHCFGCSASGNAISFIMNHQNQSFIDAVENLASRIGMQVPRDSKAEKTRPSSSLYQLLDKISQFYQQNLKTNGKDAVAYLRNRGVSGEVARKFQLGYAPAGWHTLENQFRQHKTELLTTGMLVEKDDGNHYDRYRHRIMFPIHDRNGRIIGFGGRALDADQKPKYLNSPETVIFQKNRELYGLHQILQNNNQTVAQILVVEGYMDVIALAQHGVDNAVAALGTATSTYHIQLLSRHARQLIFCFDGDHAGVQAAWRALENSLSHLNNGLDARFVFLPEGHDPDSLIREEGQQNFTARIHQAIPLNRYFINTLSKDKDIQNDAGRSQLINAARPYLQNMPEGSAKQMLVDELARMTRIENYRINTLIASSPETQAENSRPVGRSPIRLVIALLLQNPQIYQQCAAPISVEALDGEDQDVLQKLLQQTAQNPEINTATLIEQWRHSALFASLNRLAAWDHLIPAENQEKEFMDGIVFLQKQNTEHKISQFLAKSRSEGLTAAERLQLQELLKQRHQNKATEKLE